MAKGVENHVHMSSKVQKPSAGSLGVRWFLRCASHQVHLVSRKQWMGWLIRPELEIFEWWQKI